MKFTSAIVLASLAAFVRAQCPEATRFGIVTVSPSTVAPGDTVTIFANFTCAVNTFGHIAKYTDYYIEVPTNNNGYEPAILLARREPAQGALSDNFTVQIPDGPYVSGAGYALILDNTFPQTGPNGGTYYTVGGIEGSITITNITHSG